MIDRIEAISRISYLLNLAQEVGGYSRDMEELTAQDILNPLVEADVVTFNPEIIKKQKVFCLMDSSRRGSAASHDISTQREILEQTDGQTEITFVIPPIPYGKTADYFNYHLSGLPQDTQNQICSQLFIREEESGRISISTERTTNSFSIKDLLTEVNKDKLSILLTPAGSVQMTSEESDKIAHKLFESIFEKYRIQFDLSGSKALDLATLFAWCSSKITTTYWQSQGKDICVCYFPPNNSLRPTHLIDTKRVIRDIIVEEIVPANLQTFINGAKKIFLSPGKLDIEKLTSRFKKVADKNRAGAQKLDFDPQLMLERLSHGVEIGEDPPVTIERALLDMRNDNTPASIMKQLSKSCQTPEALSQMNGNQPSRQKIPYCSGSGMMIHLANTAVSENACLVMQPIDRRVESLMFFANIPEGHTLPLVVAGGKKDNYTYNGNIILGIKDDLNLHEK